MFGSALGGFAGPLGAKDDPDDGHDHDPYPGPQPPPLWKQIAYTVALSGLVTAVETFARRAVHRLFDGVDSGNPKGDSSQQVIMMLAPDGDEDDDKDNEKEGSE